jgi:predicted O-methyltransferase YrrM
MAYEYRSADYPDYKMDWQGNPHPHLEDLDKEIAEIDNALLSLVSKGILPKIDYDNDRFTDHRKAVRDKFEIPWTGISPRMQRLLYAINAIIQPRVMVAMGIFCANTFISNAGAALGPGKCYSADRLIGIEIIPDETDRARKNVAKLDTAEETEIITADGIKWIDSFEETIDILYIDANGSYLPIIENAARKALRPGSLVLAHNSVNMIKELTPYLEFVRDSKHSKESVNMLIDDQGLEVTLWN